MFKRTLREVNREHLINVPDSEVRKRSPNVHIACDETVDWYPKDTEELFLSSSDSHKKIWNDVELTYDINSYGFRSQEISSVPKRINITRDSSETEDSITVLGCSHTFGIGMPQEALWSTLLANKLNMSLHNFGVAGGSLDSAFRVFNEWQPITKSKITCLLVPPGIRYELNSGDHIYHRFKSFGSWFTDTNDYIDEVNQVISKILFDDNLFHVNKCRNIAAIRHIAEKEFSDFFIIEAAEIFRKYSKQYDIARDGSHPGFKMHEIIANEFYEMINGK